jgi:hypothetical protein
MENRDAGCISPHLCKTRKGGPAAAGKQMLGGLRSLCSVTGANKWILSRSCEEKLLEAFKRLTAQNR